ncbi:flagellin B [Campylobacter lari]|uniref:flagellin B n=1 Tax=Campylobacter lari TaxID=201 RepID=UPI00127D261A|nr:flagellin B [Campylobacter lari]EAI4298756.1 flagellin B [Campylobacter lari]EAK9945280.1 flagellin B [Campylobacter lari]EGK8049158.1 flagellin B [Campylobacter lari]MCR6548646.1 flagellin B [Campylobacter lari]
MGFRINTNIGAMNAHANSTITARELDKSLGRLSSGLRINSAADDASGMAIADSLRNQAASLGQAINNGNDAIGILQTADKAMDEQLKILDTIKVKATQAAQDGQTAKTRTMIQNEINRLMEELDNIANTTSFNGKQLLSGNFVNQEFQIGAQSNQTVHATIGPTQSSKIGHTRFETGSRVTASSTANLVLKSYDGVNDYKFQSVPISYSVGTGLGALADEINKVADKTGVRATAVVQTISSGPLTAGSTGSNFSINGVVIGKVTYEAGDKNGALVAAINSKKDTTGVEASVVDGKLILNSADGRGIKLSGSMGALDTQVAEENYGRLSLVKNDGRDILISGANISQAGLGTNGNMAEVTANLEDIKGQISADIASAMGFNAMSTADNISTPKSAGVTTLRGAMAVMDLADSAITTLDNIRADIGAVQNQITATINNISVTQVNIKSAESTIRDVDFAAESANFSKYNILAQSGSYAMSQANAVQQNVLKLLQ